FPACPVVAPLKGEYPFAGLCGTGVVWKLAQALLGDGHPFLDRHLDVVALATVADVVPLADENRALALLGLRRLAQTQKPGLRALMRVAGVDPAALDESSVGFRLAPRINASGRLCRPEAALALLLTGDDREAKRLAEELETLNRERQAVEERILRAAVDEIEAWPESRRRRRADDPARAARGVRGRLRGARRHDALGRRPAPADEGGRDRRGPDPDAGAVRGAEPARALRSRQPRGDAARRRLRGRGRVAG